MNREEAKELLPIIKAFAEGKTIQYLINCRWEDVDDDTKVYFTDPPSCYRIKPAPKYRPFKTKEECWNEMHKHPDFGWVKRNVTGEYMQVIRIYGYKTGLIFNLSYNSPAYYSPQMMLSNYTFTDGTLFGIKEE